MEFGNLAIEVSNHFAKTILWKDPQHPLRYGHQNGARSPESAEHMMKSVALVSALDETNLFKLPELSDSLSLFQVTMV